MTASLLDSPRSVRAPSSRLERERIRRLRLELEQLRRPVRLDERDLARPLLCSAHGSRSSRPCECRRYRRGVLR
jgi:hypothetical protein